MHPQVPHIARPARRLSTARSASFVATLAAALSLGACADTLPTEPGARTVRRSVTEMPATGIWAEIRRGETGPGSLYEIHVPENWNGDVVYYAHGIRDVLEPVTLRDQDAFFAFRERLGAMRYAVAWSSYSDNGYVVKDAAQRVHQLRGLFTSEFGKPERSFLAGHSLGGLAILNLAERFPSQYDGALPMCSLVGGTERQLDYVVNVRALFDLFYPGVLPGTATEIPEGWVLSPAEQLKIIEAVKANPAGLVVIASTAQTPLEFRYGPDMQADLVQSLITALTYHARGADNVLPLLHGKWPSDNTATVYTARALPFPLVHPTQLAGALAFVNAKIPRWSADPSADSYEERHYEPSGDLEIPVVTLHTRWDPLVPFFHEGVFAKTVGDAGASAMLEQRTVDAYGHCKFSVDVMVAAFESLAAKAAPATTN